MIEADYPPGTIIILYDENFPFAPVRHLIHRITRIVPTEPFLDKPIIAIDLSHVAEYAEDMRWSIVEMHRRIEEKRQKAWDEQERIRAAADHVPVARGGSPGYRPSQRTAQASAPLSDNARLAQYQAGRDMETSENIRLIRQDQARRRTDAWQERQRDRVRRGIYDNNNVDPDAVPVRMDDNDIPLGRAFRVPAGGRKSRRGRKSKKSKMRRSRHRGRR